MNLNKKTTTIIDLHLIHLFCLHSKSLKCVLIWFMSQDNYVDLGYFVFISIIILALWYKKLVSLLKVPFQIDFMQQVQGVDLKAMEIIVSNNLELQ